MFQKELQGLNWVLMIMLLNHLAQKNLKLVLKLF